MSRLATMPVLFNYLGNVVVNVPQRAEYYTKQIQSELESNIRELRPTANACTYHNFLFTTTPGLTDQLVSPRRLTLLG